MNNYQKPLRSDRNEFGGVIMLFARKGGVCNRVPVLETPSQKILCSELIVTKKKWIVYSIYRPPESSNIDAFFEDLSIVLNCALDKY